MKVYLILGLLVGTTGCAGMMRGPDTCAEIHLDTTYVLARWAGWPAEDALAISAANFWTDKASQTTSVATEWRLVGGLVNPVTVPWVLCLGVGDVVVAGEPVSRAFGQRVAESTAWTVPTLARRLHFPTSGLYDPVTPAFHIHPTSGEIEYGNGEARRVLERSFLDLQVHDEDRAAVLALLGIGLHTLQDSFKHCGYTAARGHVGAHPDPDDACTSIETTLACAAVTFQALRYARRLDAGRSSSPPPGWKDELRRCFLERSGMDGQAEGSWGRMVTAELHDDYADRDLMIERWKQAGGEEDFGRAVERAREALQ